jgi:hypothetical protein
MESSEPWYQLFPGAVFAFLSYPVAILITFVFVFYYAAQRWRKLWAGAYIRPLCGST